MKKLFSIIILALSVIILNAQPPQGINYQAVARNASGQVLATQAVGVRISIVTGTSTGTVQYSETHSVTTNQFGLFNIVIGNGTVASGTFAGITWSTEDKFIKVEVDPAGGASYVDMGTSKFQSVPYALAAPQNLNGTNNMIVKFSGAGNGVNSSIYDSAGYVGIGTSVPTGALEINTTQLNNVFKIHNSAITNGNIFGMEFGKTNTTNNMAEFRYNHVADGSALNFINLGLWGNTNTLIVQASGNVGIGTTAPSAKLDVIGTVKSTGITMTTGGGANKVLTSDATGNATWQNGCVYTSITPPSCQSGTATPTFVKLGPNLGTFNKVNGATKIEISFQTFLSVATFSSSTGVFYELRVDDVASTNGKAAAVVRELNVTNNVNIIGLFTGLSTGSHTISIWIRSPYGSASTVSYDSGCWGSSNVLVKEIL